jgi:hypothetical protein
VVLPNKQGHRRIAEQTHLLSPLGGGPRPFSEGGGDDEQQQEEEEEAYQIIQHHPVESGAGAGAGADGRRRSSINPFDTSPSTSFDATGPGGSRIAQAQAQVLNSASAHQSMFSLRANKSMRLQRFGAWIAYHDTQSEAIFWYNHESAEGRWEEPEEVKTLKQMQESNTIKTNLEKVRFFVWF